MSIEELQKDREISRERIKNFILAEMQNFEAKYNMLPTHLAVKCNGVHGRGTVAKYLVEVDMGFTL